MHRFVNALPGSIRRWPSLESPLAQGRDARTRTSSVATWTSPTRTWPGPVNHALVTHPAVAWSTPTSSYIWPTWTRRNFRIICAGVLSSRPHSTPRIADLMIVATAIVNRVALYTTNPDDFTGLENLPLSNPCNDHKPNHPTLSRLAACESPPELATVAARPLV